MAYEVRGSYTYDCIFNSGTGVCSSKYPEKCKYGGAYLCLGTYGGLESCSSFYTTQSACNSGFVYYDTLRQCKWNVGTGVCDTDMPCTNV